MVENRSIKQVDNFFNFCEIISFLDNNNWNYSNDFENWGFIKGLDKIFNPHKIILWHWVVYIHDRMKKTTVVWSKIREQVKVLLDLYFRDNIKTEEELKKIYNYVDGTISDGKEQIGTLKYIPADNKSVFKTLSILLDYDKNIIKYLKENYDNWDRVSKEKSFESPLNETKKLAYLLYKLSYPKSTKILEEGFLWHKRIWAATRDYVRWNKLNKIFTNGLNQLIISKKVKSWIDYFKIKIEDFELPGDVWNIRFAENFFVKFSNELKNLVITGDFSIKDLILEDKRNEIESREIELKDFITKTGFFLYPKLIRILYERVIKVLKKPEEIREFFYPSQLDLSFIFAAKLCDQNSINLCKKICIFGNYGGKNLCVPESIVCPIGFVTCGYIMQCVKDYESNCPIYQMKGKNLCKKATE